MSGLEITTSACPEIENAAPKCGLLTYSVTKTPLICPACGSRKAHRQYERWSDGFVYHDAGCPECGWSEVY